MSQQENQEILSRITNLKSEFSKWYVDGAIEEAIEALQSFYLDDDFDEEDFAEDWTSDDIDNCQGIDVFIQALNHSSFFDNEHNKRILFNWCCHWLFPETASQPQQAPPTITGMNVQDISIEITNASCTQGMFFVFL